MHRVRMSLPWYRQFGWEPTVLCVSPQTSDGVDEPDLTRTVPDDIGIVRADAWDEEICRRFGFGLLDFRALIPLHAAGSRILRQRQHDVIFFSTTAFMTLLLGRLWQKRFGCKIVYDFQDPWYVGDDVPYTRDNAPGGWRKYRTVQRIARHAEPYSMRAADHVIAVSPGYVKTLAARYPFLKPDMFSVIPFGAAPSDYACLDEPGASPRKKSGEYVRWVSVGRAGADMEGVLAAFFGALARLRRNDPTFSARLRVEFIGTNYAPAGRSAKLVEPIAARFGVLDIVRERPERIPYLQALAAYRDSDAILMFGSNAADYTASKLFGCALAGRPVLAMFHAESPVCALARDLPNIRMASFRSAPAAPDFGEAIASGFDWLRRAQFAPEAVAAAVAPWTAERLTAAQCAIFDRVCNQ